jgi:hypothetical protein
LIFLPTRFFFSDYFWTWNLFLKFLLDMFYCESRTKNLNTVTEDRMVCHCVQMLLQLFFIRALFTSVHKGATIWHIKEEFQEQIPGSEIIWKKKSSRQKNQILIKHCGSKGWNDLFLNLEFVLEIPPWYVKWLLLYGH